MDIGLEAWREKYFHYFGKDFIHAADKIRERIAEETKDNKAKNTVS